MLIGQLMTRNNELKQLNDMYADLANLGMAAEIVSHELNQLFNNIYDAIHQLRYHGVSSEGRYYLNQINIGFRAISDRMSQMSPMYRSRSMYKRNVNVYEMLEDLHRFFDSQMSNLQAELDRTGVAMETVQERYKIGKPETMSEAVYKRVMEALGKTKSAA